MKLTVKATRSEADLLATLIPALAPMLPKLAAVTDLKDQGSMGLVNPDGKPGRVEWEIEISPEP
jgi:hypothetical protein